MPNGSATSIQVRRTFPPPNAGRTIQYMSTRRITRTSKATISSERVLRLTCRNSSRKNGKQNSRGPAAARRPPDPLHPAQVPGNFVREIFAPDDQVLRKFQIGPQHHERQQEAAQVLEMRGLSRLAKAAFCRRARSAR